MRQGIRKYPQKDDATRILTIPAPVSRSIIYSHFTTYGAPCHFLDFISQKRTHQVPEGRGEAERHLGRIRALT